MRKELINYCQDAMELVRKHRKFIVKFTVMITALYAAMAVIAIHWYEISEWFQKFKSGRCSLKWNPGKMGKFVTYDDDDTTGGLDADEADE